ncbi:hypothetical protein ACFV03_41790, partial [Streptomyces mirabilis]|uniref:hypothetical protein n=1 Tax=Streptomyces mirabilis TaxID=68239 RepID=UPI003691C37E
MDNNGEQGLTVYYRHLAAMLRRSDDDNFDALMDQADHVTRRSYETTLQDHQQTFRLLWRHLERSGYLQRIHREARARLTAGNVPPPVMFFAVLQEGRWPPGPAWLFPPVERMTWGVVPPGPRGAVGDADERSDYRLA